MNILEVSNLSKHYGDATALNGATLTMEAGEIHAIVGENGAGKSTLVKVLSGIVVPDKGSVKIADQELEFGNPRKSGSLGVSTAFQELSLISNLSVAENVLISDLPTRFGIVTRTGVESQAREILHRWGVDDINVRSTVASLSLSAKQRIEIVCALNSKPKILILDEPSAALSDTSWLFEHVQQMRDAGTCVIYISHKLAEIKEICDRGTIMRNGAIVGEFLKADFDHEQIISTMIGRSISLAFPPRESPLRDDAATLMEVKNLAVGRQVSGVSLDVRAGEIVGIAGLEGQGQRELFYALGGAIRARSGEVRVEGEVAKLRTPRTASRSGPGIALVPEERKREGIFADMSSIKNISVPVFSKVSTAGIIRNRSERSMSRKAGIESHLPEDFLTRNVGQLSGGNQQKTVLARTALSGAQILLMFDPTRGIDPSAKLEVYSSLRKSSGEGVGVLLYSTEIPELLGLCDRILVMYDGKIVASMTGSDATEEKVMAAAVGRHSSAQSTGATQ
ncbi:MAG: sugar ABC transporter ATP-binding protein [Candidatus Nanopelagicales bacterium]